MSEDLAVNAAMGDKNNTTEDIVAEDNTSSVSNKKNPMMDSASYFQNNLAEDHVTNNNYDVGYEVTNSYELAWELSEDLAINPAMGPIYTNPLSILAN
jgi:hypothetical protein